MSIDKHSLITRSRTPVETTVGTEVVLMSLASGLCFGLGETGSDVWRLLARPSTIANLAVELSQSYAAPVEVIEADVTEMVEKMIELDLASIQN